MISNLGIGASVWTIDAKDAYLRVPVQRCDWRYMGMKWFDMQFAILSLSFGLASACRTYTNFADAVFYIIRKNIKKLSTVRGLSCIEHYVDDFFGGHPHGPAAEEQYKAVIHWFDRLCIPTKAEKCIKPDTKVQILGFVYNTISQTVAISAKRCNRYLAVVTQLLKRRKVSKLELLSIIGKLRWCSYVLFPGQAFVRILEKAAIRLKRLEHTIHMNSRMRVELTWWLKNLPFATKGVAFATILRQRDECDIEVYTDASSTLGVGGFSETSGKWFQFEWCKSPRHKSAVVLPDICFKELAGVVLAAILWSEHWSNKNVHFWCDNIAVVEILKKKCCTFALPDLVNLVRILCTLAVRNNFRFWIDHIAGKKNITADILSRVFGNGRNKAQESCPTKLAILGSRCPAAVEYCLDCFWNSEPSVKALLCSAKDWRSLVRN